ncbi:hypothetical protein HDU76_014075 [Blyttiomyces sp. JEL0837]|nr:hypothetical protein HDU76_014075 [Blyttiomyces sp. JEL0837]
MTDVPDQQEKILSGLPRSLWLRILLYTTSLESYATFTSSSKTLRTTLWPNAPLISTFLSQSLHSSSIALLTIFKSPGAPSEIELIKFLLDPEGCADSEFRGLILHVGSQLVEKADIHFYGDACLRTAVRTGKDLDIIKLLLNHGADASVEDSEALKTAANKGRWDLVKVLIECEKPGQIDEEVLIKAIETYSQDQVDLETIKALIKNVNPSSDLTKALICVVWNRRADLLDLFISMNIGNVNDERVMLAACWINPLSTPLESLQTTTMNEQDPLDVDEILSTTTSNPINPTILKILTSKTNNHRIHHDLPLSAACLTGDISLVQTLLDHPTNPSTPTSHQNLPIRCASAIGSIDLVSLLLSNGADVEANETDSLIQASEHGHTELVKYLLETAGADLGAQDDAALRGAAGFGYLDTVKYLVSVGADVHADEDDSLARAAGNGHVDVVKFLLENGADVNARGKRAVRDATRLGRTEVLGVLEEAVVKAARKVGRKAKRNTGIWGAAKVVVPGVTSPTR